METTELAKEVANLKEIVMLINSTVKFHFQIQWTAFALILASTGTALYYLARQWFQKGLDDQIKKVRDDFNKIIETDLKNTFKIRRLFIDKGKTTLGLPNPQEFRVFIQVEGNTSFYFVGENLNDKYVIFEANEPTTVDMLFIDLDKVNSDAQLFEKL